MGEVIKANFRKVVDVEEMVKKYNGKDVSLYFHLGRNRVDASLENAILYIEDGLLVVTEEKHIFALEGVKLCFEIDLIEDYKLYLSEFDQDLMINTVNHGLIHINSFS